MYIYLDESGDLGFDFINKKPSKFFTICILVVYSMQDKKAISNQIKRTLIKKLHSKSKKNGRIQEEIKATSTEYKIKRFIFNGVKNVNFEIYAMTLNKKRIYTNLIDKKNHIYNFITRLLLEKINFNKATENISLILDKSKNKREIKNFNEYILIQLQSKINPIAGFNIYHKDSKEDYCLNMVDLFAWGIFRKYEKKDTEWFDVFKDKIKFEEMYLQ